VIILLLLLLAALIAVIAISLYLCWRALHPRRMPLLKSIQIEIENGHLDEAAYRTWPKQEVKIRSPSGYYLAGTYFPTAGATRTLIFAHGHGYTRMGGIKIVPFFQQRGFNVLLYDQRGHGFSDGKTCTYGFYESRDLKTLTSWALQRLGPNGQVATMGESLGAATCLLHAAQDPRVAFVIADSPYARLTDIFIERLERDYHLPRFPFIYTTDWFFRLLAGFSPRQVSPVEAMPGIQVPVLIIHGSEDSLVPFEHAQQLYQAKTQGICRLFCAEGAGHVEAYDANPKAYQAAIDAFLTEIGQLAQPAEPDQAKPPKARRKKSVPVSQEAKAPALTQQSEKEQPTATREPHADFPAQPDKQPARPARRRGRPPKVQKALQSDPQSGGNP